MPTWPKILTPTYSSSYSSKMSTHRTAWSYRILFTNCVVCKFLQLLFSPQGNFCCSKISKWPLRCCMSSFSSLANNTPAFVVLLSQVMATFVFTCDRVVKIRSQALHQIVVEIFFRRGSSELLFFLYCVHYFVAGFSALDLSALTQSSFAQILAIFFCGLCNRSNSSNTQIC